MLSNNRLILIDLFNPGGYHISHDLNLLCHSADEPDSKWEDYMSVRASWAQPRPYERFVKSHCNALSEMSLRHQAPSQRMHLTPS